MEKEATISIASNSIKRGLLEVIKHAKGRAPQTRVHRMALR